MTNRPSKRLRFIPRCTSARGRSHGVTIRQGRTVDFLVPDDIGSWTQPAPNLLQRINQGPESWRIELIKTEPSPTVLQYADTVDYLKQSVAQAFGIPAHLLDGPAPPPAPAPTEPLNGSLHRPEATYTASPLQVMRAAQALQQQLDRLNRARWPMGYTHARPGYVAYRDPAYNRPPAEH